MSIIDSHLHIGNISDKDIVTPADVKIFLASVGVNNGLVMPVALRGGYDDWEKHSILYEEAIGLGFHIALYVNPTMLDLSEDLSQFLIYPFKALKIHPDAVDFSNQQIEIICAIAEKNELPLMIHTGFDKTCHCERFRPFIQNHPKLIFVFCHARPSEEAFPMMREFPNLWIDTAFLSFNELVSNISKDVEDRILFGTDFPVNRWFPHLGDERKWYANQISLIRCTLDKTIARKIFYDNYCRLYKGNF
jgi:predicted TIM-barrel fold metal-dependent hydrolase